MVNHLRKVAILITLGITGINSLYSFVPCAPGIEEPRNPLVRWLVGLLCSRRANAAPGYQPIPQDDAIEAQEQGEPIPQDDIGGARTRRTSS